MQHGWVHEQGLARMVCLQNLIATYEQVVVLPGKGEGEIVHVQIKDHGQGEESTASNQATVEKQRWLATGAATDVCGAPTTFERNL